MIVRLMLVVALCLPLLQPRAQSDPPRTAKGLDDFCGLQKSVAAGDHKKVVVRGVFGPGLDRGVLEDKRCPEESTWVELAPSLRGSASRRKLRKFLYQSENESVVAVFEGEFYGAPLPDPALPEAIKKNYHPGWGHLGGFKTRLIVHAITKVSYIRNK